MAWKELLRNRKRQDARPADVRKPLDYDRSNLISQICGDAGPVEEAEAPVTTVLLPDGYVRRSPVQAYRTPADYNRRKVRKAIVLFVGLALLVLVGLAIWKSGWIRLS